MRCRQAEASPQGRGGAKRWPLALRPWQRGQGRGRAATQLPAPRDGLRQAPPAAARRSSLLCPARRIASAVWPASQHHGPCPCARQLLQPGVPRHLRPRCLVNACPSTAWAQQGPPREPCGHRLPPPPRLLPQKDTGRAAPTFSCPFLTLGSALFLPSWVAASSPEPHLGASARAGCASAGSDATALQGPAAQPRG